MAKKIELDMANAIVAAVIPAKEAAVARAEKEERAHIARVLAKMEEHGFNLDAYIPCPRDCWDRTTKARRDYVRAITTYTQSSRSLRDPEIRARKIENETRVIEQAKEATAAGYDAFVAKLVAKIGDVVSAELSGDHVWGYSILTVSKADGSVEHWKTQQIVNRSVHNLLFNQWPSRKVK